MRYVRHSPLRQRSPPGARARPKPKPAAAKAGGAPGRAKPGGVIYKANVGMRVAAGVLDVLIPSLFPGVVFLVQGWIWAWGLVVGVYLLLRDGMMIEPLEYTSVGKRIVGLHAEMADSGKTKLDPATSAKRNATIAGGFFLVPVLSLLGAPFLLALLVAAAGPIFELVTVVRDPEGLRQGDRMAGTKVLD